MRRLALLAVTLALACTGSGKGPPDTSHQPGDEVFVSTAPGGGVGGDGTVPPAAEPGTAGPSGPSGPSGDGAGTRALVEADVYARRGALVYVQNTYRGLQVVDLADPAHPRLRGQLPLTGTPVGLYLVGDVALVTASDVLRWLPSEGDAPAQASYGARLWAVDISDPDHPALLSEQPVAGAITDSRLVGDALYVVSRNLPYWCLTPMAGDVAGRPWPAADQVTVASFDVSSPAAPRPVDHLDFAQSGWSMHVHVTAERITVAGSGWEAGNDAGVTQLTAVDISDPAGRLVEGARITVAGQVQDRWALDLDAATGTFRVVTADQWSSGARLHVLAWAAPDQVAPLGGLDLDVPERVTAARFDGARAYVVTALAIDPLWVVDLADPAQPALAGHLEMPGQLDYLVPRGDRLLALGHGGTGAGFQLHVSLLDVADPAHPALLARRVLSPDWAFVPASPDDLQKAFQVLDEQGLILLPYQGYDRETWSWSGGTQLFSFTRDTLVQEGFVAHLGDLKRAFPTDAAGVLGAFSDQALQTIDARDRAHPVQLGQVDLARPVWDLIVSGDRTLELSGLPWWGGMTELAVTPAANPEGAPSWRTPLAAWWTRLLKVDEVGWVVGSAPYDGTGQGQTFVQAVDLSGDAPRLAGRLELGSSSGYWYGDPAQVGRALVVPEVTWDGASGYDATFSVVDLSSPDAPAVVSEVALPVHDWMGGVTGIGHTAWFWHYDWAEPYTTVRYALGRLDLADPAHPVLLPEVNVPGWFFSASDDGQRVYTQEYEWDGAEARIRLHALELTDHGTARLIGSVAIPGWTTNAVRVGQHAYLTGWRSGGEAVLYVIDLDAMALVAQVPIQASWMWAIGSGGGKLFLATGWPAPSVLVVGIDDPAHPVVEQTVPTSGYQYRVEVGAGAAYLPAGAYGVLRIPL
ncbi:MAG: beta-propeller domain-containing protein [Anaeromyxobacter sp.]